MTSQKGKRAALRDSILGLAADTRPEGEQGSHDQGIVSTALGVHRGALLDKVEKLETELAQALRSDDRLVKLVPDLVDDPFPADRDRRAYADAAFDALRDSIAEDGQHVPILVRLSPVQNGRYEVAAGRRRLAACRSLGRTVLARVVETSDEGMLALQYRENALRKDISVLERGRWLRHLAERYGLSTTKVAALVGLSQPMVVEYQKLARLPEELLERLADPRELSLADARRLQAALAGEGALERAMATLATVPSALGTKVQVQRVLQAAAPPGSGVKRDDASPASARVIRDERGSRVAVLTRSGAQWVCRFAKEVDEEAVRHVVEQVPQLLAAWREQR